MAEPLADPPRWSLWRRGIAMAGLAGGFALVLLGASPWVASDVRAGQVIGAGEIIVLTSLVSVIGGATLERGAAWLGARAPKPIGGGVA